MADKITERAGKAFARRDTSPSIPSLGPAGEALRHSAAASYTDAMAVLLVISAVAGVVAAVISGLVLRSRTTPVTTEQSERPEQQRDSLTPITVP